MARTWKTEPYQVRRARLNGKRAPKRWREVVIWRSDNFYREMVPGWDDLHYTEKRRFRDEYEDEIMGNHDLWWYSWMRLEAPPKDFRQMLNRQERRKNKESLRRYGEDIPHKRNARWLWW